VGKSTFSHSIRATNELSSSEPGLAQVRLIKNRIESSRVREKFRDERSSSNSARYYSS
jgi:hypothetical protein